MKVGQKVQAKLGGKNRWRDVVIKRVNKSTIRVELIADGNVGTYQETFKYTEVRKKPRKKTPAKARKKKVTTTTTKAVTKQRKTTAKPETSVIKTPKPGTKKNPLISLYDLRSHNAISGMSYEDKVKFEAIIKSVIKDL